VIDVTALTFTDVAGLGVVLHHERELARAGGAVEVRSPSPMLRRIVQTLALQDRLHLGA
jgi:anti-anti-sigma factor